MFTLEDFVNDLIEDVEVIIAITKQNPILFCLFSLLLYILLVGTLVYLSQIASKKRSNQNLIFAKLVLVIMGRFIILLTVLSFLMTIGYISFSSLCGFLKALNRGDNSLLESLDHRLNPLLEDLFGICYNENSNGRLDSLVLSNTTDFQNTDYVNSLSILNGLSLYMLYQNETTNASLPDRPGLNEFDRYLESIQTGARADHFDVLSQLEELNGFVDCNDEQFALNSTDCSSSKTCREVLSMTDYNPPSCTEDSALVSQKFNQLKLYASDMKTHIAEMRQHLKDTAESPQQEYQAAINDLNDLQPQFETLKQNFAQTLGVIEPFQSSLEDIMDCRAIRDSTLQFEVKTCFQYQRGLFALVMLHIFFLILLMLAAWMIYFVLINEEFQKVDQMMQLGKLEEKNREVIMEMDSYEETVYDDDEQGFQVFESQ
jgi:predicted membrane protein